MGLLQRWPIGHFMKMTAQAISYVADLIESGRLSWPPKLGELQSQGLSGHLDECWGILAGAAKAESSARTAAWLFRQIAAERAAQEVVASRVQPVVSGPRFMSELRQTDGAFREIIEEAKHSILIVGFAIHNGKNVLSGLADRMRILPALEVVLCLDISRSPSDTSDDQAIIARFAERFRTREWPGGRFPKLYFDHRSLALDLSARSSLHAKVIVADNTHVLIGSANLTDAAFSRNIEIGASIALPHVAASIRTHIESLVRENVLRQVPL